MAMQPQSLDHVVLRVADVERSVDWYTSVLGLTAERLSEWRRGEAPFPSVRISTESIIDLVAGDRTGENIDHFCIAYGADLDLAALAASGLFDVVDGPGPRWGAQGMATSLYVRDPDGNVVELRTYPS